MTALLLAAALAFTEADAATTLQTTRAFVEECTPRDAGTIRSGIAANWLLDHASMTGADVRRDVFFAKTPDGERRFVNLYASFQHNSTSRWVVLVSHYDTKHGCPGANDGAVTSALLVTLTKKLSEWKTPYGNTLLVWTDGEECQGGVYAENDGLQGSKRAVEYLKEKGLPVQAVLVLDMLGDRDLHISIPANGTTSLAKIACHAARRIGHEGLVTRSDLVVKDDHVPFLDAGYNAIDLIDFEYGPGNSWWHTEEDTCEKLSEASILKSGRLVCELLKILL